MSQVAEHPVERPVDWSEDNLVITGARSGPLRLDPYQVEPLEQLFAKGTTQVTCMWSSQLGKTTEKIVGVLYFGVNGEGGGYCVFSSDYNRKDFLNRNLLSIIRQSGFEKYVKLNRAGFLDKEGFWIGDNYFRTTTAGSKGVGHSVTARLIMIDEYDDCFDRINISDMRQRGVTFIDRVLFILSTPSKPDRGIAIEYDQGSRAEYYCPCPYCGTPQVLDIEDDSVIPPGQWFCKYCPDGGKVWDEADRRYAVYNGEWVHEDPTNPHKSYRLGQAASLSVSLQQTYSDWLAAEPRERSTQINARPYEQVKLPPLEIHHILQTEQPFPTYKSVLGVDLQGNRLEWVLVNFSESLDRLHVFRYGVIPRTEDLSCWESLKDVLRRYPIHQVSVDAGFEPDYVHASINQVFPSFLISSPPKIEMVRGDRNSGGSFDKPIRLHKSQGIQVLAVDEAKSVLYAMLFDKFATVDSSLSLDVINQLMSERLIIETNSRGTERRKWVKNQYRNEVLDCVVYAMGGSLIYNKPKSAPSANVEVVS